MKFTAFRSTAVLFLTGLLSLTACKKNDTPSNPSTPTNPSTPANPALAARDSAVAYDRDIYLWYKQIPTTFTGSAYSSLEDLMAGLRQYSSEPGFTGAVDKWSFAIPKAEWDNVSSGIGGDFGINVFFKAEGDLRVRMVEKASPAGIAGIQRGWRITSLNGSTNITTTNATAIVAAVYQSASTKFGFIKPDGTTTEITLNAATYQTDPFIADTIYSIGGKKIAYLSYGSFLGDTTKTVNRFAQTFSKYSAAGINDLIVDLRYNGGGYVNLQQKMANYLAPSAANGQLMMSQMYNDKYTQYNISNNFIKSGALNLSRIFFIVSGNTASASELLINNLRPFMDVQLIGPTKTYGKPVGYFPIPVSDHYIFPVSFRSTNNKGEGNYFGGMTLNSQVPDGLDRNWGDVNESCLAQALKYITTGSYRMLDGSDRARMVDGEQSLRANAVLEEHSFKGAVDSRKLKL